jgi:hypothetical protein
MYIYIYMKYKKLKGIDLEFMKRGRDSYILGVYTFNNNINSPDFNLFFEERLKLLIKNKNFSELFYEKTKKENFIRLGFLTEEEIYDSIVLKGKKILNYNDIIDNTFKSKLLISFGSFFSKNKLFVCQCHVLEPKISDIFDFLFINKQKKKQKILNPTLLKKTLALVKSIKGNYNPKECSAEINKLGDKRKFIFFTLPLQYFKSIMDRFGCSLTPAIQYFVLSKLKGHVDKISVGTVVPMNLKNLNKFSLIPYNINLKSENKNLPKIIEQKIKKNAYYSFIINNILTRKIKQKKEKNMSIEKKEKNKINIVFSGFPYNNELRYKNNEVKSMYYLLFPKANFWIWTLKQNEKIHFSLNIKNEMIFNIFNKMDNIKTTDVFN